MGKAWDIGSWMGQRRSRLWLLALPLVLAAPLVTPPALHLSEDQLAAQERPQYRWSVAAAGDLLTLIGGVGRHGLDPAAYEPEALQAAIGAGASEDLDAAADASALLLARHFARGRIETPARFEWYIDAGSPDDEALAKGLHEAVTHGRVVPWLEGLLPQGRPYAGLVAALAVTPASDVKTRAHIIANLERWRWMPRQLGPSAIWVNVPTYRLRLIEEGVPTAEHVVVVGSTKNPTPQLSAMAKAVTVNPWWTVPPSVLKEQSRFGRGYVTVQTKHGPRIRQKPGPRNALGKVKFEMDNPHAIYLHDTPSKAMFGRKERALSHGCIRVKDVDALAAGLTDPARFGDAYAEEKTKSVPLRSALPVYIVYFTVEPGADGRTVFLGDPYGRDMMLAKALGVPVEEDAPGEDVKAT